jgi:hypothetical protein
MVPPLGVQRQRHALGFYGQRGTQEVYTEGHRVITLRAVERGGYFLNLNSSCYLDSSPSPFWRGSGVGEVSNRLARRFAHRCTERGGLFLKPKFKSLPRQLSLSTMERERGG